MAASKVIFLDRDGTINVDHGFVHRIEDWEFTDRAPQALKKLHDAGFLLAVITNQSGIAQGLYSLDDMRTLHDYMRVQLAEQGVQLAAIAFCPHGRDSTCACRKPGTDMAQQIKRELGAIDYTASWTVGDKLADLAFGQALGTQTALIRSRYWGEADVPEEPDLIVDSLWEAAEKIVG